MAIIESELRREDAFDEGGCHDFEINLQILNDLIEFKRRNDPYFKGRSDAEIAEMCRVSETTFKGIKSGRNKKPRIDILYAIVATFRGSIDRIVGLAPPRDYEKEAAVYDATLMATMRSRVQELEQQHAADSAELDRLRKELYKVGQERATAYGRVDVLESELAAHGRSRLNLETINARNVTLIRTLASGTVLLCGMLIAVCVIAARVQ